MFSMSLIFPFYLQVYDATAKIPSGLLNGNVNQFGDFDECIGIRGSEEIQGQYCLAYLHLSIDESRVDLKYLHRLLHSHYAFRSNITDVSTYLYYHFFFCNTGARFFYDKSYFWIIQINESNIRNEQNCFAFDILTVLTNVKHTG